MSNSSSTLLTKCTQTIISAPNFVVFSYLDLLDSVFCVVFKYLDQFFEGKASQCYCTSKRSEINGHHHHHDHHHEGIDHYIGMSETMLGRKEKLRQFISLLEFVEKLLVNQKKNSAKTGFKFRNQKKAAIHRLGHRWSDCVCESCIAWTKANDHKLHVVTEETSSPVGPKNSKGKGNPNENVVFIHGILSSSQFWTKSVFPKLCEPSSKRNNNGIYSLFAVDLLGYGKSPKPRDCTYTVNEHVEWIEKSVISPFELNSFHLVAHSMGCILALALAAKHSKSVKSITLVAPPYFPSEEGVELKVMNRLTPKALWPPEAFLSAVMSWYEHVGRSLCFFFCRNHRIWEGLITRLTGLRDLNFIHSDLTKHTHHSGWHTTHNVLFRGVKDMDKNIEILRQSGTKIHVVFGSRDTTIPALDCSNNIKNKFPDIEVIDIAKAGHRSIVFKRKNEFAKFLLRIWENAAADHHHMNGISI